MTGVASADRNTSAAGTRCKSGRDLEDLGNSYRRKAETAKAQAETDSPAEPPTVTVVWG